MANNKIMSCNCIGPQNGEPVCPCVMEELGIFERDGNWVEPEKIIGPVAKKLPMPFSQKSDGGECGSYMHNPPMGLYVAPGTSYVHVCPSCGETRAIHGSNITFSADDDADAFTAESDDEVKTTIK